MTSDEPVPDEDVSDEGVPLKSEDVPGTRPALAATGLGAHRGKRQILVDVDLAVQPGEVLAVLGPNGAGKSTLMAALGGSLPPSSGTVTRHGRLASVLQTPSLARRTARVNVELATAWADVPRAERGRRVTESMQLMRVDHLAQRQARTLSGGEQRRVHLARALAVSPEILLLDEPFDGLDPHIHEELREDAAAALRRSGSAVVVVLHDRRDAWAIADRVAVLIDGRIAAQGTADELLDRPPSAQVARFLGYNGELTGDGTVLLTRPVHVRIEPDGDLTATVTRRFPTEDGVRLQLRTGRGELWTLHPGHEFAVGDEVRVSVHGGREFPA